MGEEKNACKKESKHKALNKHDPIKKNGISANRTN